MVTNMVSLLSVRIRSVFTPALLQVHINSKKERKPQRTGKFATTILVDRAKSDGYEMPYSHVWRRTPLDHFLEVDS
jgi:endoglucanase Acf2